jgi:hypothetical protein
MRRLQIAYETSKPFGDYPVAIYFYLTFSELVAFPCSEQGSMAGSCEHCNYYSVSVGGRKFVD